MRAVRPAHLPSLISLLPLLLAIPTSAYAQEQSLDAGTPDAKVGINDAGTAGEAGPPTTPPATLPPQIAAPPEANAPQPQAEGEVQQPLPTGHGIPTTEIVVSATKTTVPASYAPVTSYTVNRADIERQPDHFRSNYGQLIQDVPGVFVGQATYKTPAWINLRGTGDFSARTLYLVDGLPVGSSIALTSAISVNDIERIDIVMGPSSALYGANASGGVVNIVTRQGEGAPLFKVAHGFGSHNTHRPYASAGGSFGVGDNTFHYLVSYSGDYSDGYKNAPLANTMVLNDAKKTSYLKTTTMDDANIKNTYLSGKLGWKAASGASLTLAYNYSQSYVSGGQPNLVYLDYGYQGMGSLRFQLPIADIFKLTVLAGYQSWNRPSKNNKGLSLSPTSGEPVVDSTLTFTDDSKVRRTPLELQGDVFLGKYNVITVGGFFCGERIESARHDVQKSTLVSESTYHSNQYAVYLQDQAFLFDGRLSVLAGMRYDYWRYYDIHDSTSNPTNPEKVHDSTMTYRGGLKYQILNQLAVRSSAGTAFYPGLSTWYFQNITTGNTWREANPNLKPEKTWSVDLGVDAEIEATGTTVNVTGYYGKISDMFSGRYDPHPTQANVSIIRYSNVGKTEIYGLETRLVQRIIKNLSVAANLTLNHSKIVEDPVNQGNQVSHAPKYMANLALRYLNPAIVNGMLTVRAVGSMHYDTENIDVPFFAMKAYQTADAKVWREWQLNDRAVLHTAVSMENLFDRQYAPEFYYASPGRTMMAVLGMKY